MDVECSLRDQLAALKLVQTENGLWRTILDDEEAYEEAKQIRKEVAINLLEEGWTVEKIAMGLKEDVETVKKWLQQT